MQSSDQRPADLGWIDSDAPLTFGFSRNDLYPRPTLHHSHIIKNADGNVERVIAHPSHDDADSHTHTE